MQIPHRETTEGLLMKRIAVIVSAIGLCQLLMSCDSGWPYKPTQFTAPTPPPPKHAFVSPSALDSFCSTRNVTLLYSYEKLPVLTQTIYFAHLNDSNAVPLALKKPAGREKWKADCPNVSPDGKFVTYHCFSASQCAVYIQRIDSAAVPVLVDDPGSEPHFYKDAQGYPFVTYASSSGFLDGPITSFASYATYMKQIDTSTGRPGSSRIKIAPYPFYGGLSKDGRYLCTGYKYAYLYDRIDSILYPIDPNNQVCNPSITPDSVQTDRMMFLNFAGKQNMANFTESTIEHKDVFIVDKNNNKVSYFNINTVIDASKGEWQRPRWSSNPGYFTATAQDPSSTNSNNYDIYLVSIQSGKALRLNNPDVIRMDPAVTPYVFFGGAQ
jgi:hypothetical protein